MRTIYLIIFLIGTGLLNSYAQTKPRKKIIQTHQTIFKDSIVYLPDTIACYFKELVITDTVIEKWKKGFVIWQTWSLPNYGGISFYSGNGYLTGATSTVEYMPLERPYQFSESCPGIFLYADKTKVTNKVIMALKR